MKSQETAHYDAVRRVLWGVFFANLSVALVKISLGAATGVLAVVADGFHSLVDTSSNLIGLAAIRLARRPADERYPYGYRRYETIGALAIGVLLLLAAWELIQAIIGRISAGEQPAITPLFFGLVLLTLPVNLLVVYLETRAGRRLNSELLVADAAHTRADLYVTVSVLASMVGVWLGWAWLDVLVAALVLVFIVKAAVGILHDTISWLSDVQVADTGQIEAIAESVPGVLYVHRIRSRGTPRSNFVDLHVKVPPGMSTSQAHAIASEVERRLKNQLPNVVDALVHIEPGRSDGVNDWERIAIDLRQIADGMRLGLHDLHVHVGEAGEYAIELHLEMDTGVTLGEAHTLAEEFESRVKSRWSRTGSVITHLEPITESVLLDGDEVGSELEVQVRAALLESAPEVRLLELQVHALGDHLSVAMRLAVPSEMPLVEAHGKAERIERDLLSRFERIGRVVVHLEPPEKSPEEPIPKN